MTERWTPETWRNLPIQQVPVYPDLAALGAVEAQLATFPPLVFAGEARKLKRRSRKVANGEAFLLQGGDCAESFAEHSADNIRDFFRVLPADGGGADLRGRLARREGRPHRRPVREAPLARPRRRSTASSCRATAATSSTTRTFTAEARIPDPRRQIEAYRQSAATLNLLRAFATGGYANLDNVASLDARLREG